MAAVVPVHARAPVGVLMILDRGNMPAETVWRFPGASEPVGGAWSSASTDAGSGSLCAQPSSVGQ